MSDLGDNNLMVLLGGISALFAVTFFFFVRSLMEGRARRLAERLRDPSDELETLALKETDESMRPLDDFLRRSGMSMSPEQAVGWMTFVSVALAAVLFLIQPEWWVGLIGLVLGSAAVWVVLMFQRSRYRRKLQDQLPDTIFLIARSLRAGLSLEQGISLVGTQGVEPLASEFRHADQQIKLGLTIPLAMELTAKRLSLGDFNALVSTVSLYSNTGGNLPLMLDRLAQATRDHNQFRAFYRSATALGRISATCIAGAGPAFFVGYALMQPEYASFFFTNQVGILTITMAAFLEIIGIVWLWNIIRIDY